MTSLRSFAMQETAGLGLATGWISQSHQQRTIDDSWTQQQSGQVSKNSQWTSWQKTIAFHVIMCCARLSYGS